MNGRLKRISVCIVGVLASLLPLSALAQVEIHQDIQGVWHAKVLKVSNERMEVFPPSDVVSPVQTLDVRILEGERTGEIVSFENDFIQLKKGDRFFMNFIRDIAGNEYYSVREVDRRIAMLGLLILFAVIIVLFGGLQGVRSLVALIGSVLVIAYLLIPALTQGVSPIVVSIVIAACILFFAIFFTHGFSLFSLVAYAGTVTAVILTGLLAYFSVNIASLTGIATDEATYLNFNTGGELDFIGLLLAAIIIGALGVLDDIAITQVAVVRELYTTDPTLSKWQVYNKAMRVGREHVSALVNTLVLAYTGAALPLIMLFSLSDGSFTSIINREIFATEIVRTVVGSIGLILTVPLTTWFAILVFEKYRDSKELEHMAGGHTH